ncbi:hypothetical protein OHB54_12230 [Streptomyces sp. NBC_01007]|nr:hypothetical protein OHB54_12230 [Streptomyces sp. NBC_01007]
MTAPLDRLAEPIPVTHRAWDDEWTAVRCAACGRESQWPHPELGCPCGTTLRIPLRGVREERAVGRPPRAEAAPGAADTTRRAGADPSVPGPGTGSPLDGGEADRQDSSPDGSGGDHQAPCRGTGSDSDQDQQQDRAAGIGTPRDTARPRTQDQGTKPGTPGGTRLGEDRDQDAGVGSSRGTAQARTPDRGTRVGVPRGVGRRGRDGSPERRPAFQPVTIRTARDAVTAAALYLGWLGYRDIRRADQRPPSGIGLAARGILAQVDPTVRPASLRDVECLWLTAMTESADCVFFSLAGYADDARARADTLGVPLFVLDLTGTPQPVNSPADELIAVTG